MPLVNPDQELWEVFLPSVVKLAVKLLLFVVLLEIGVALSPRCAVPVAQDL